MDTVNKVNEIEEDAIYFICDICWDISYHGSKDCPTNTGGIAVKYTKKLCEDCKHLNTCCYCGTWCDNPKDIYENGCSYCLPKSYFKEIN